MIKWNIYDNIIKIHGQFSNYVNIQPLKPYDEDGKPADNIIISNGDLPG